MTRMQITASIVALAALVCAAPAFAEPLKVSDADEKVSVVVHYSDADLHSISGAARMAARIRSAARQVCGGDDPVMTLSNSFPACEHRAVDRALASLDAPLVADALGRAPRSAVAAR
jgi:UrcA family protein